MKKLYRIALARYEQHPGDEKPTKRNIFVFDEYETTEKRAIAKVHFKGWGKRPLVDIEREPGHRLWNVLEVWDGEKVYGV